MIGRDRLLRLSVGICLVAGCSDSVPDGEEQQVNGKVGYWLPVQT